MHRVGSNPFCAFVFAFPLTLSHDALLNFDGDVDANANVKCEHSISLSFCLQRGEGTPM